jgi:hypothetical protein
MILKLINATPVTVEVEVKGSLFAFRYHGEEVQKSLNNADQITNELDLDFSGNFSFDPASEINENASLKLNLANPSEIDINYSFSVKFIQSGTLIKEFNGNDRIFQ